MEINFDKIKQAIPTVVIAVTLLLGTTACKSSSDDPSSYDPNTDPTPALSIDL